MAKFYVFAYDEHEEHGGIHDLIAVFDTFEEAEQSLFTMDTSTAPYGYFEDAHVAALDEAGNLIIMQEYWNTDWYLNDKGEQRFDCDDTTLHWKTYPELQPVKFKEVVSYVSGGSTGFDPSLNDVPIDDSALFPEITQEQINEFIKVYGFNPLTGKGLHSVNKETINGDA